MLTVEFGAFAFEHGREHMMLFRKVRSGSDSPKLSILLPLVFWFFVAGSGQVLALNSSNTPEDDLFWTKIADAEKQLLDKDKSQSVLQALKVRGLKNDEFGSRAVWFKVQLSYLETWGTPEDVIRHFQEHPLEEMPDRFMMPLIFRLAKAYLSIGNRQAFDRIVSKLKGSETKLGRIYQALLALYVEQSQAAFTRLNAVCDKHCNFDDYHWVVMQYYSASGRYQRLESHAKQVLDGVVGKTYVIKQMHFDRWLFGYLALALEELERFEEAHYFCQTMVIDLDETSTVYKELKRRFRC